MEIRQQVKLSPAETKQALAEYCLRRKSLKIKPDVFNVERGGEASAFTMTEEEIWQEDTARLLLGTISVMKIDALLKKKLVARYTENTCIALLLENKLDTVMKAEDAKQKFLNNSYFNTTLYRNSGIQKRDALNKNEEAALIKFFGELGIPVKGKL